MSTNIYSRYVILSIKMTILKR